MNATLILGLVLIAQAAPVSVGELLSLIQTAFATSQ